MEQAARELNEGFFCRITQGRPWVRVKIAHSLDGRTALRNGSSQWISSPESREDVQYWRARSCAILTGIDTVLADDPALTVRLAEAKRQPLRVIADSRWRTPPSAKTLTLAGEVLVAGREDCMAPEALKATSAQRLHLPEGAGGVDLKQLMHELASREINEVQVEAGPTLCGALMRAGLVDEVLLYQAPSFLGTEARGMFGLGDLADMRRRVNLRWLDVCRIGPDLRIRLKPLYGAS
jgi:diaminohydroxyphosphoribosylaminopyrimidine deaminase/5-amino-6-(5-phosphoribosylamino)uracil reductase